MVDGVVREYSHASMMKDDYDLFLWVVAKLYVHYTLIKKKRKKLVELYYYLRTIIDLHLGR